MYAEKIARLGEKLNDNNAQRLVDALNRVLAYTNNVVSGQIQTTMLQIRLEGEDYRSAIQQLNIERNHVHDKACEGLDIINDLSKKILHREFIPNFELIQTREGYNHTMYAPETRGQLIAFAGQLTNELYLKGAVEPELHQFDQAVQRATENGVYCKLANFDDLMKRVNDELDRENGIDLSQKEVEYSKDWIHATCYDNVKIDIYRRENDQDKWHMCTRNEDGQIFSTTVVVHSEETADYRQLYEIGTTVRQVDKHNAIGHETSMNEINEIIRNHGGLSEVEQIDVSELEKSIASQELEKVQNGEKKRSAMPVAILENIVHDEQEPEKAPDIAQEAQKTDSHDCPTLADVMRENVDLDACVDAVIQAEYINADGYLLDENMNPVLSENGDPFNINDFDMQQAAAQDVSIQEAIDRLPDAPEKEVQTLADAMRQAQEQDSRQQDLGHEEQEMDERDQKKENLDTSEH